MEPINRVVYNGNSGMYEVWVDDKPIARTETRSSANKLLMDFTANYPAIKGVIQNETSSTTESTAHEGS